MQNVPLFTMKSLGQLNGQNLASGTLSPHVANVRTDGRAMRVYGVCSTESVDLHRESVNGSGIDWTEHRSNPIVTRCHEFKNPEGVVAHAVIDGDYTVQFDPSTRQTVFGSQFFTEKTHPTMPAKYRRISEEAFGLIDAGAMRGVSITMAYLPQHAVKFKAMDGGNATRVEKSIAREITFAPLAMNAECLVRVVEKGVPGIGQLSDFWKSIYVPQYKAFTHTRSRVFRGVTFRSKAMDETQDVVEEATMAEDAPVGRPAERTFNEINTYVMAFLQMLQEEAKKHDNNHLLEVLPKLEACLTEAAQHLHEGHEGYRAEYPDATPLPGSPAMDMDADTGAETDDMPEGEETEKEELFAEQGEPDGDEATEEVEEEEYDDDGKPIMKSKAFTVLRRKSLIRAAKRYGDAGKLIEMANKHLLPNDLKRGEMLRAADLVLRSKAADATSLAKKLRETATTIKAKQKVEPQPTNELQELLARVSKLG